MLYLVIKLNAVDFLGILLADDNEVSIHEDKHSRLTKVMY